MLKRTKSLRVCGFALALFIVFSSIVPVFAGFAEETGEETVLPQGVEAVPAQPEKGDAVDPEETPVQPENKYYYSQSAPVGSLLESETEGDHKVYNEAQLNAALAQIRMQGNKTGSISLHSNIYLTDVIDLSCYRYTGPSGTSWDDTAHLTLYGNGYTMYSAESNSAPPVKDSNRGDYRLHFIVGRASNAGYANQNASLHLINVVLDGRGESGGIETRNRNKTSSAVDTSFKDVTFQNCNRFSGGSALVLVDGVSASIDGCVFDNNQSTSSGGALALASQMITVKNSVFSGNKATGAAADGGAVNISGNGSQVTMDNCTFSGNTAARSAGAIHIGQQVTLTIKNSRILNNSSKSGGGGIFFTNSAGILNIDFTTISGNSTSGGSTAYGGGLFINQSVFAKITNSTIHGNTSSSLGGGIYVDFNGVSDNLEIEDTVISQNKATEGGGIYASATEQSSNYIGYTRFTAKNVTFSKNKASFYFCLEEHPSFNQLKTIHNDQVSYTSLSVSAQDGYSDYAYNNYDIVLRDGTNPHSLYYVTYHDTDSNIHKTEIYEPVYTGIGNATAKYPVWTAAKATQAGMVKQGQVLAFWSTQEGGLGTKHNPGDEITYWTNSPPPDYLDLYANWRTKGHQVNFYENIAAGETPFDTQEIQNGQFAALPATDPVRSGYTFTGWYRDTNGSNPYSFGTPVTDNLDLFAGWQKIHTVSFYQNEADTETPLFTQPVLNGQRATVPNTEPVRSGYTFKGWYTDKSASALFSFNSPVTGDVSLYAGWEKDDVTPPTKPGGEDNGGGKETPNPAPTGDSSMHTALFLVLTWSLAGTVMVPFVLKKTSLNK